MDRKQAIGNLEDLAHSNYLILTSNALKDYQEALKLIINDYKNWLWTKEDEIHEFSSSPGYYHFLDIHNEDFVSDIGRILGSGKIRIRYRKDKIVIEKI